MKRNYLYTLFVVLLMLVTILQPSIAQQARGVIQISGVVVDSAGESFNPMAPKNQADARYPAYPVSCHYRSNQCFTLSGRYLGTMEFTAANYLFPVSPEGIKDGTIVCDRVCFDYLGRVVGAAPKS